MGNETSLNVLGPSSIAKGSAEPQESNAKNFSYTNLFISHLSKKKQIRKIMITEYNKENKNIHSQETSLNEKHLLLVQFKVTILTNLEKHHGLLYQKSDGNYSH
jgi:hypothetical protein